MWRQGQKTTSEETKPTDQQQPFFFVEVGFSGHGLEIANQPGLAFRW